MIYSAGTPMSEVDPLHRGITWNQYVDILLEEAKLRMVEKAKQSGQKIGASEEQIRKFLGRAIATPRDRYGMKGMPSYSAPLRRDVDQ